MAGETRDKITICVNSSSLLECHTFSLVNVEREAHNR